MIDFDALVLAPGLRAFGEPATYTPAGGTAVGITVVLVQPDKEVDLGVSGLQPPSRQAEVRAAELPEGAARGDQLTVGAETFVVRRITHDALRLVATLDLDPA